MYKIISFFNHKNISKIVLTIAILGMSSISSVHATYYCGKPCSDCDGNESCCQQMIKCCGWSSSNNTCAVRLQ